MGDAWLTLLVVWTVVALALWLWLEFNRRDHGDW